MNAFQRFATAGYACGVLLAASLGPPLWATALLAVTGVLTALAIVLVTRLLTGDEVLTRQHHELAVLAVSAAVLALAGQPVLAGLDAVALGLGLMLAVGRIGCLAAGCCHGLPSAWGIAYTADHLDGEFPAHLAGVRLLPVPGIEAAATLATVGAGVVMVESGAPPGTAGAWLLTAVSAVRFGLELLRGDVSRRRALGVTEPQWIALALTAGLAIAGAGIVSTATAVALGGATAVLMLWSRDQRDDRDIHALAACLRAASAGRPSFISLPSGLLVSAGRTGGVDHLTLSTPSGSPVHPRRARRVATLATRLSPGHSRAAIQPGGSETVHVLLR